MQHVFTLFDLIAARPLRVDLGRSQRIFLATLGLLCAIGFAAAWGLAVNPTSLASAAGNAVKVPMLLVVSGAATLPAVVLFWKLTGAGGARGSDLVVGYAVAVFGGTLVLAVLAPVVALYVHSSAFAGPYVTLASALLGFAAGVVLFLRALDRLLPAGVARRSLAVPVVLTLLVQLATLSQLASVISPVFARRTAFGRGVDVLSDDTSASAAARSAPVPPPEPQ